MNFKEITILYKNCNNTQCWKQCVLDKDKFKHLKRNQLMYVFDRNMRWLKKIKTWEQLEEYVDKKLKEREEEDLIRLE